VEELRTAVARACAEREYGFRAMPLISDAGLFGAIVVVYSLAAPLSQEQWNVVELLAELTAISLNKAYQHQKLQKAFDDLRISQETLIRTEKFRALGQMAAGIAHDLKNLLNPLQLYTDVIRDSANDPKEVVDIADRLDRVLTRGLETVERLRGYSRLSPDETEEELTDLNSMVSEALEISKPRLKGIEVQTVLADSVMVMIRPADCVTAIVNLLFNAADALEGQGRITISTGKDRNDVWVEIADNGPGIPPEVKKRILEPLFTTKGNSGTGLGVPIVYAFTQRHGGRLDIESTAGQGARFRMSFPIPQKTADSTN
jgi:signal transduction histidine kinase